MGLRGRLLREDAIETVVGTARVVLVVDQAVRIVDGTRPRSGEDAQAVVLLELTAPEPFDRREQTRGRHRRRSDSGTASNSLLSAGHGALWILATGSTPAAILASVKQPASAH